MKSTFKSILAFILCVALIGNFALMGSAESAAGVVSLSVDKAAIFAGDSVTVTMTLSGTLQNVVSFDWQVRYDSTRFTLTGSAVGGVHPDMVVSAAKADRDGAFYSVSFVDRTSAGVTLPGGTVCTLTFTAKKDGVADGVSRFSLVSEGVFDSSFSPIPVSVGDGSDVLLQRVLPVGLTLETLPDRLDYRYKEALDTTGMVLVLHYNNGQEETVTKGYTLSREAMTVQSGLPMFGLRGKVPVQVSYFGFETTFTVNVRMTAWQWLIKILLFGWLWY